MQAESAIKAKYQGLFGISEEMLALDRSDSEQALIDRVNNFWEARDPDTDWCNTPGEFEKLLQAELFIEQEIYEQYLDKFYALGSIQEVGALAETLKRDFLPIDTPMRLSALKAWCQHTFATLPSREAV